MDFIKYFKYKYKKNVNNCWEFVRYVYKEEHNIDLPELPILDSQQQECKSFLRSNIKHKIVKKAKKGDLVHVWHCDLEHIGYAINENEYIHLKSVGVLINKIPEKCLIYEVKI